MSTAAQQAGPRLVPETISARLHEFGLALSHYNECLGTEEHLTEALEQAMDDTQHAKTALIRAARKAALLLPEGQVDQFLSEVPVPVERPKRPRLVLPKANEPLSTKDKPPLPRKVITDADDPELPEFLRPPFKGRHPTTTLAVYKWLRRNPSGQSVLQIAEALDLNVRVVDQNVRRLEGHAVATYKNLPASKFQPGGGGRAGAGGKRVRAWYVVA